MTVDRRAFDPFAPIMPKALTGVVEPEDLDETNVDDPADDDGFDDMKRVELVELAADRGVPGYGTKADIIARLRD